MCRKVRVKLESSSVPHKDDMILHLAGDEGDECTGTEEWLNAVNRGGLWHVNDGTYYLFEILNSKLEGTFQSNLSEGPRC